MADNKKPDSNSSTAQVSVEYDDESPELQIKYSVPHWLLWYRTNTTADEPMTIRMNYDSEKKD